MLTGDKDARTYVEPDTHRRGYSVRPAYRPEPQAKELRVNAFWALAALVVIGAVFGVCVAVIR